MIVALFLCAVVSLILFIFVCWNGKWWPRNLNVLRPDEEYVIISGCDSGIGYYCARLFDRLGFRVFAGCLFPQEQGAKKLAEESSSRLQVVHLDVTNEDSVNKLFQIVEPQVSDKGVWALVNNAGILCYGEFEWLSWRQCEQQCQVNLLGTIRLTKTLLPLVKLRNGRILTMTSVNGLLAYPAQAVYCATKFGLEGFCNSLRLEMKKHRVDVAALQLGDFARLTNILCQHQKQVDEMWENMSTELKRAQGDYFKRFHQVTQSRYGLTSPNSFEDSQLTLDLTHFVMAFRPKSRYLCMPLVQRIFFKLLLLLPANLSDNFLLYLFKNIFKWKTS